MQGRSLVKVELNIFYKYSDAPFVGRKMRIRLVCAELRVKNGQLTVRRAMYKSVEPFSLFQLLAYLFIYPMASLHLRGGGNDLHSVSI